MVHAVRLFDPVWTLGKDTTSRLSKTTSLVGKRTHEEFFDQRYFDGLITQNFFDVFGVYDVDRGERVVHGFCEDVAFFKLYIQTHVKETMYSKYLRDLVVKSQNIIST